jgi:hypothetical protein
MPCQRIVSRALELGVSAFDTSPYYGPSEILLGDALASLTDLPSPAGLRHPNGHANNAKANPGDSGGSSGGGGTMQRISRSDYKLITKAGRIAGSEFDYSPSWVRYSVLRSLQQLHTPYLDLVYAHDVEFVSPAEVIAAVRELRRLRDEDGLVRYVGISGYPVPVLCELAEAILRETGEGLDAVLSYGHFTVQNTTLGATELMKAGHPGPGHRRQHDRLDGGGASSPAEKSYLRRLKAAGVDVVLNASMLGMGLLTSMGIPRDPEQPAATGGTETLAAATTTSPLARWHPSPPGLRVACKEMASLAAEAGERLESVAICWALGTWARVGADADAGVQVTRGRRQYWVGASVMGVSSVAELEETVREWDDVVEELSLAGSEEDAVLGKWTAGTNGGSPENRRRHVRGTARQDVVLRLVEEKLWPALGEWRDFSWASPQTGFVNSRPMELMGVIPQNDGIMADYEAMKRRARPGKHDDGTG